MNDLNFPRYMRSNHPDVRLAYMELMKGPKAWADELMEDLSERLGQKIESIRVSHSPWSDDLSFSGIYVRDVDVEALPGRWKKPKSDVIHPFKNNTVYQGLIRDWTAPTIPGVKPSVTIEVPGHGVRVAKPTIFEWNNYVHIGWPTIETTDDGHELEYGWERIRGSQFLGAKEYLDAEEALVARDAEEAGRS